MTINSHQPKTIYIQRAWTAGEEAYLRDWWHRQHPADTASALGRRTAYVRERAREAFGSPVSAYDHATLDPNTGLPLERSN